jgi:transposase-like protein
MPKSFPTEFRRRVLALVEAGRPVREVAADLEIAAATIYRWRTQALVDAGVRPGITSVQNAELVAARRRIRELEAEVAILKRAATELRQVVHPKGASR